MPAAREIAPEVGADKSSSGSSGGNGGGSYDEFQNIIASGNEAPQPPPPPGGDNDEFDDDHSSVMARNKYTIDNDEKDEKDIEEAVVLPHGESKLTAATTTSLSVSSAHPTSPIHHQQRIDYPPSLFTNDRGNLKIVSLVVRNPCRIFWLILLLCIIVAFLLQVMVFRKGQPFTTPSNEFDLSDVRSVQYDSYRLAASEVAATRKAVATEDREVPKQSQLAAIAYWIFEGETPEGVFGSREAVEGMKAAFDIFLADPAFDDWCVLQYPKQKESGGGGGGAGAGAADGNGTSSAQEGLADALALFGGGAGAADGNGTSSAQEGLAGALAEFGGGAGAADGNGTSSAQEGLTGALALFGGAAAEVEEEPPAPECQTPITPLTMYYASQWDAQTAAEVIDELKDPAKVEKFNSLSTCVVDKLYCDILLAGPGITLEDRMWVMNLSVKIGSMIQYWDMKGELVEDFGQVTELASYLIRLDQFKKYVDFGFDKGFSAENPVSQFSRGIVFWGGPLEDRNMTGKEEDEDAENEAENTEDDLRREFIKANYLEEMNVQSQADEHSTINSYYFMTAIIGDVILDIVTKDATLAIFSFVFVFIWLRINTLSWFLAFVGFFEIFFSIPVAWFIFTVIFQINYFATLNSLALFVVAAIGADDIFIFMDAYKQSQYHPELLVDLETRMSWVYRRTGTAMAITSATTCAAFLCTLITPLPSLQSFGIFAAVVIFIDYVLVMSLFCTAVVIYHNRYENSATLGCCCPCGPVVPSNTEQALTALEESEGEVERDRVSEFFKVKVAGFVQVPLARAMLGVLFAVWLGIAIWQASLLEPTKENEQFLNEDHPLQKSVTILNKEFPTASDDLGLKVYFAWGIGEVNRKGVNRLLEPENYGSPTFLPEFNFNEQCQVDLLSFCDSLKTDPAYSELIKRKDGLGQVYCFIEELGAYNVKGDLEDCEYVRKRDWKDADNTWTVDPAVLPNIMPDFLTQKTCYDDDGEETISGRYQKEIGWNGFALMFASVSAESNVLDPFGRDSETLTRREYDQFIEIAEKQSAIMSGSCGGEVIMTDLDEKFVFMNNQAIYVQSAIQSAILGVAIAFVVLLLSTRVLHIAFFASLSIMSVLISVVGMMVMLGWNLGSIESTLIGIIAGFSVDYVVHLAHAYEIASGDTYARITEAFGDLGISVFNGMITSVAASIPLFFCRLQFFAKFGTFLCLTIAFSWIFANFGFMSVLAQLKIPLKGKGCIRL